MSVVRVLVALALVLASGSVADVAAASCIQEDLAAKAARAETVVHGRVIGLEGQAAGGSSRYAQVEVLRVLKGSAPSRIGVALGPEVGGGPGPAVVTSIDYRVEAGSEHTLFLRRVTPAGFATDGCSGSHPGGPTPEETALFGPGSAPDPVPAGVSTATATDLAVAAVATLIAVVSGVAAIAYARRSAGGAAAAS